MSMHNLLSVLHQIQNKQQFTIPKTHLILLVENLLYKNLEELKDRDFLSPYYEKIQQNLDFEVFGKNFQQSLEIYRESKDEMIETAQKHYKCNSCDEKLVEGVYKDSGFRCDKCNRSYSSGGARTRHQQCDYDLCIKCGYMLEDRINGFYENEEKLEMMQTDQEHKCNLCDQTTGFKDIFHRKEKKTDNPEEFNMFYYCLPCVYIRIKIEQFIPSENLLMTCVAEDCNKALYFSLERTSFDCQLCGRYQSYSTMLGKYCCQDHKDKNICIYCKAKGDILAEAKCNQCCDDDCTKENRNQIVLINQKGNFECTICQERIENKKQLGCLSHQNYYCVNCAYNQTVDNALKKEKELKEKQKQTGCHFCRSCKEDELEEIDIQKDNWFCNICSSIFLSDDNLDNAQKPLKRFQCKKENINFCSQCYKTSDNQAYCPKCDTKSPLQVIEKEQNSWKCRLCRRENQNCKRYKCEMHKDFSLCYYCYNQYFFEPYPLEICRDCPNLANYLPEVCQKFALSYYENSGLYCRKCDTRKNNRFVRCFQCDESRCEDCFSGTNNVKIQSLKDEKVAQTLSTKRLEQKQLFSTGSHINSESEAYRLCLQENGNLEFIIPSGECPGIIWESQTKDKGQAPYFGQLCKNGNLVIFDQNCKLIWSSNSRNLSYKGNYSLTVRQNRNFIITDSEENIIFSSNTFKLSDLTQEQQIFRLKGQLNTEQTQLENQQKEKEQLEKQKAELEENKIKQRKELEDFIQNYETNLQKQLEEAQKQYDKKIEQQKKEDVKARDSLEKEQKELKQEKIERLEKLELRYKYQLNKLEEDKENAILKNKEFDNHINNLKEEIDELLFGLGIQELQMKKQESIRDGALPVCKVCMCEVACCVNLECSHLVSCEDCMPYLEKRCPVCRKQGQMTKIIF